MEESIERDAKDYPSCSYSTSSRVLMNMVNGKRAKEVIKQATRHCPNEAPVTVFEERETSEGGEQGRLFDSDRESMLGSLPFSPFNRLWGDDRQSRGHAPFRGHGGGQQEEIEGAMRDMEHFVKGMEGIMGLGGMLGGFGFGHGPDGNMRGHRHGPLGRRPAHQDQVENKGDRDEAAGPIERI